VRIAGAALLPEIASSALGELLTVAASVDLLRRETQT
jgi:hypothetical protein